MNGTLQNELSEIESNIIGELLINPYLTQQEIADKLEMEEEQLFAICHHYKIKKLLLKMALNEMVIGRF